MTAFATAIALTALAALDPTSAAAREPGETKGAEKSAVTIWIVSYERRDANPLGDEVFLPKLADPALAKLKDKGAKKIAFNFEQKQVAVWFEGKQAATVKDVQEAFPGLDLKLVAKAAFPEVP